MTEAQAVSRASEILFAARNGLANPDKTYATVDAVLKELTPRYGATTVFHSYGPSGREIHKRIKSSPAHVARWHRLVREVETKADHIKPKSSERRRCECGATLRLRQKKYCSGACQTLYVGDPWKRSSELSDEERRRICELYGQGLSLDAIRTVVRRGTIKIKAALSDAGVKLRPSTLRRRICATCFKPLTVGHRETPSKHQARRYCQTQECKNAGRRKAQQGDV